MDNLIWLIVKNYMKQGIMQFYKIIGSVDLIGNPIGLVDKLGSGVYEFFNEPRKGLLKGPEQFISGIGKGVRSLLSNIVSGSFGSVGKVTGSLYGITRSIGGHDTGEENLEKPANLFTGVFYGVKGGLIEVYDGVTGVVIKPVKGCRSKKKKFSKFLNGVRKGIFGLAMSPFAAVLRISHEVTQGIANTATFLGKGRIKLAGRFRFPRQFGTRKILEPYNEEIAQAVAWLRGISEHRHEKIVYFVRLDKKQMVLMTNQHILLVKNAKRSARVNIALIKFISTFQNKEKFSMRVAGLHQLVVKTPNAEPLEALYNAILLMPTKIDRNTHFRIERGKDPMAEQCCQQCHFC